MMKSELLNSEIIEIISKMGHTDEIVIGDAGLPIPEGVRRIDLALITGQPAFLDVLEVILKSFECEGYVLAHEIKDKNPMVESKIIELLGSDSAEYITHEEFKNRTGSAKAVIRTGECTPYANIILKSGVIF